MAGILVNKGGRMAGNPMAPLGSPRRSLRDTLDLLVALSALLTSAVSIWLAISQGDEMEKLVQAQSWPFVGFHSGNSSLDPGNQQRIRSLSLSVENLGVGPAKLRTLEVFLDGRPLARHDDLVRGAGALAAGQAYDDSELFSIPVGGRVLRAGESITYFRWNRPVDPSPAWDALDKARFERLLVRACFCSVFNECWITRSDQPDAESIAACPLVEVPYSE